MATKEASPIVQFMTLVEDFTPIKPIEGKGNTFEDGMFFAGLFGLKQNYVFALVIIGLVYALLVMH
jgi:hypothetical protein